MIIPFAAAAVIAAVAAPTPTTTEAPTPARASIAADKTAIWPGGTINLAITFKIDKGWHLYWRGQNDSGFSPGFEWTLPAGVKVGEIRWPLPQRHVSPGDVLDHVYEHDFTLIVPLTADKAVKPGATLQLGAKGKWLVCNETCLPGDGDISIAVPVVASESEAKPSAAAGQIATAVKALPQPAPATLIARVEGSTLIITDPGAEGLSFFPDEDGVVVESPLTTCTAKGDTLRIPLDLKRQSDKKPNAVVGILESRFAAKKPAEKDASPGKTPESTPATRAYSIQIPLKAVSPAASPPSKP